MTLLEEYAKAYPSMTDEERLDAKTNKDNKYNSIANRYFFETTTFGEQNIGRIEKLYNQIANSFNIQEFNEIITRRANEERAKLGLQPLVFSEELSHFAKTRSDEALINYDHTRPDGRKFSTVFADASPEMAKKYAYAGENLAGKHLLEVMDTRFLANYFFDGWMESKGHRENILRADFNTIATNISVRDFNPNDFYGTIRSIMLLSQVK